MNVFATDGEAAAFAADCFAAAARDAIHARGRFVVALAGGHTPRLMYATLAAAPHAASIDWPNVVVLWSDERCVPPDHPASNYRMAREALLSRVSIADTNVHRIRGETEPANAAAAYERELRGLLDTPEGAPALMPGRRIDFALLGLGDDGHTASLFPGRREVHNSQRWAEATTAPTEPRQRITLTPLVINSAAEILFLVTGTAKASILRRVTEEPRKPAILPAHLIAARNGILRWVVDTAAASGLHAR